MAMTTVGVGGNTWALLMVLPAMQLLQSDGGRYQKQQELVIVS